VSEIKGEEGIGVRFRDTVRSATGRGNDVTVLSALGWDSVQHY
jgi:hypothetical protein